MKKINIKKLFLLLIMMLPKVVLAEDYAYRGKELKVVYIIGIALLVIRIVVPILLIVMASIDLVKALVQNDDKDTKKVLKGIVPKVIISIIIFVLPTVLLLILKLTNSTSLFSSYSTCLLKPSSCSTQIWEDPPEIPDNGNIDPTTVITPPSGGNNEDDVIDSGTLKIYFLAYGRYDSYLIVGNGSTIFIDGGYEYGGTLSVKFMKQLGIKKIDALIGSHLDNNHVDAHKKIIKELEVVHVYYNDDPNTCIQNKTCKGGNSANPTELAKLIKDNNIPLTVLTPGNNIKIGNLIFDCVGPQTIYTTKEHYYSDNYNSLNLILKFGNNKFYFSGDGIQEDEILAKYDKKTLDVDLFKYPHHGQQVSGEKLLSVDFVKILSPKYVMIPAKSNNLERNMKDALKEMGAEVILTGTGGNTLVESDGNNIKVVRNFSP